MVDFFDANRWSTELIRKSTNHRRFMLPARATMAFEGEPPAAGGGGAGIIDPLVSVASEGAIPPGATNAALNGIQDLEKNLSDATSGDGGGLWGWIENQFSWENETKANLKALAQNINTVQDNYQIKPEMGNDTSRDHMNDTMVDLADLMAKDADNQFIDPPGLVIPPRQWPTLSTDEAVADYCRSVGMYPPMNLEDYENFKKVQSQVDEITFAYLTSVVSSQQSLTLVASKQANIEADYAPYAHPLKFWQNQLTGKSNTDGSDTEAGGMGLTGLGLGVIGYAISPPVALIAAIPLLAGPPVVGWFKKKEAVHELYDETLALRGEEGKRLIEDGQINYALLKDPEQVRLLREQFKNMNPEMMESYLTQVRREAYNSVYAKMTGTGSEKLPGADFLNRLDRELFADDKIKADVASGKMPAKDGVMAIMGLRATEALEHLNKTYGTTIDSQRMRWLSQLTEDKAETELCKILGVSKLDAKAKQDLEIIRANGALLDVKDPNLSWQTLLNDLTSGKPDAYSEAYDTIQNIQNEGFKGIFNAIKSWIMGFFFDIADKISGKVKENPELGEFLTDSYEEITGKKLPEGFSWENPADVVVALNQAAESGNLLEFANKLAENPEFKDVADLLLQADAAVTKLNSLLGTGQVSSLPPSITKDGVTYVVVNGEEIAVGKNLTQEQIAKLDADIVKLNEDIKSGKVDPKEFLDSITNMAKENAANAIKDRESDRQKDEPLPPQTLEQAFNEVGITYRGDANISQLLIDATPDELQVLRDQDAIKNLKAEDGKDVQQTIDFMIAAKQLEQALLDESSKGKPGEFKVDAEGKKLIGPDGKEIDLSTLSTEQIAVIQGIVDSYTTGATAMKWTELALSPAVAPLYAISIWDRFRGGDGAIVDHTVDPAFREALAEALDGVVEEEAGQIQVPQTEPVQAVDEGRHP